MDIINYCCNMAVHSMLLPNWVIHFFKMQWVIIVMKILSQKMSQFCNFGTKYKIILLTAILGFVIIFKKWNHEFKKGRIFSTLFKWKQFF